jgi:hypothetical protein
VINVRIRFAVIEERVEQILRGWEATAAEQSFAMGFTTKSARSSGLTRRRDAETPKETPDRGRSAWSYDVRVAPPRNVAGLFFVRAERRSINRLGDFWQLLTSIASLAY